MQVGEFHQGKPSPIHSSQWATSLTVPAQLPASVSVTLIRSLLLCIGLQIRKDAVNDELISCWLADSLAGLLAGSVLQWCWHHQQQQPDWLAQSPQAQIQNRSNKWAKTGESKHRKRSVWGSKFPGEHITHCLTSLSVTSYPVHTWAIKPTALSPSCC